MSSDSEMRMAELELGLYRSGGEEVVVYLNQKGKCVFRERVRLSAEPDLGVGDQQRVSMCFRMRNCCVVERER